MKVLEKNRLKVYDDVTGQLVEEREATLEDLLNILVENYELDVTLDLKTGTGIIKLKKVK
jgi:hypothetical protein